MDTQTLITVLEIILKIVTMTVILMGLMGTVLQFLTYSRRKLLKLSFSIYFRVLSIVDAFIIVHFIRFYVRLQFDYNIADQTELFCKLFHYSIYAAGPISEWIMIAISIDRLVAIVFPRRFMFFFQKKWQILILLFIFAFNLLYFSFMFWDMHLAPSEKKSNQTLSKDDPEEDSTPAPDEPQTTNYVCSSHNAHILYWLDLMGAALVPFSLMIVIDVVLIVFIFKSRKRVKALVTDNQKISSRDRKFSITSISLNFIILIFNAPTTIYSMLQIDQSNSQTLLVQNFFHFLFYSHYALGFYVQIMVNSIIRKEFLLMLRMDDLTKRSEIRCSNQSELKAYPSSPAVI